MKMQTKIEEIQDKIDQGYVFQCGAHYGPRYVGYWAIFQKREDHTSSTYWEECGHGFTVDEAVSDALKVLDGKDACSSEVFEVDSNEKGEE